MDAADTRASPEKEEVICMRSITVQRLAEFTEQDYEFTFGITRKEFAQMLEALNAAYCKEHRRRPHFTKITMQDKLVLTLLYRREYRSMENIAAEYGVSRDTIADNIHWVERALLNANLLQNSVTWRRGKALRNAKASPTRGGGTKCRRGWTKAGLRSISVLFDLQKSGHQSRIITYVS